MRWQVGTKMAAGFGLALAVYAIVAVVSYRATVQLVDAMESRGRSFGVMRALDGVSSLLQDIHAGPRGYALTGDEDYLERYQRAIGRIDGSIDEVRRLTVDNPLQQNRVEQLDALVGEIVPFAKGSVDIIRERGTEAGRDIDRIDRGKALMDEARQRIDEMLSEETALREQRVIEARADASAAKMTIVFGAIGALLISALAGFVITRNIARPLRELSTIAERIALGDLSEVPRIEARDDEVGALTRSFARMTAFLRTMAAAAERIAAGDLRTVVTPQSPEDTLGDAFAGMTVNLRDQLGRLIEGAQVLGSAASEIVASTAQLAAGASESAAAVSETTTTVDEVRQTAEVANQKARQVADNAQKAAQSSQSGRKSVEDMAAGMARIQRQMEAIGTSMMHLTEQSQTIGQIIATVEDLAAQSNLLAVNAGIEAAKAGEYGRGFGVVAQEVKSLAEQSRQATNQVRTILGEVQKATATAMMATEQGARAVEAGARQAELAGVSIQQLTGSVGEAAQAAVQIAASSQQQLVGMEQVAGAMDSIKQASAQNVASARQMEAAARNLSDLGGQLTEIVQRYRV